MKAKYYTLEFGEKSTHSNVGKFGCSHGMYSGGNNYYMYSLKNIFSFEIYVCWGSEFKTKNEYQQLRKNWTIFGFRKNVSKSQKTIV